MRARHVNLGYEKAEARGRLRGVKTAETKTFTGVTTVILYDGLNEKRTVSEEKRSDIPDNI
jgi:hypothetical protein